MSMLRLYVSLTMVVLLTACIPSLRPLYTEKDLVAEPAVLGEWRDAAGEKAGTWRFTQESEKAYLLTTDTSDGKGKLEARIVEIEGHRFLDLYPKDDFMTEMKLDPLYRICLIPAHEFFRFELEGDRLTVTPLHPEWLSKQIEAGSVDVRHEKMEDFIVLTAPSAELQRLVVSLVDKPEAWGDPIELTRAPQGEHETGEA